MATEFQDGMEFADDFHFFRTLMAIVRGAPHTQPMDTPIEEYEEALDESILPESDLTDASLFVEGVAMVRLASQLSIRILREYPFVPDVALSPSPADSFPTDFKVWD